MPPPTARGRSDNQLFKSLKRILKVLERPNVPRVPNCRVTLTPSAPIGCQAVSGCAVRDRPFLFMLENMEHESSMSTVRQSPFHMSRPMFASPDRGALMLVNVTLRPVGPGRGSFNFHAQVQHNMPTTH